MDTIRNSTTGKKVMVAGHICLDITPVFSSQKAQDLKEVLTPGKLVHVGAADIHTGGSVANTGLGMKILGADVKLAGKIGRDQFGQIIKRILAQHGCEEGLVEDENSSTSYSVVLAVPEVDRIFLHNPGANDTFCSDDITDEMLEGISHFHLGYPPLMKRLYARDGEELYDLFQRVKEKDITTSLDMAAVDPNSEAGDVNWRHLLQKLLPLIDFFVPSVEEVCFMLNRLRYQQWNQRAKGGDITQLLSIQDDVKPLADELLGMGAKVVLIKCGAPGIYYRTAQRKELTPLCLLQSLDPSQWCGFDGFEISYRQENIVSGTGAGDTSIAAFLTSMLQGRGLKQCVQLAAATGSCCISAHDALSGLLPLDVLQQKIEAGWEKENFIKVV